MTSIPPFIYTYCLNNPLIYTDPDGEFFLGTVLTFIGDLIRTAFFKGGLDPTSKESRNKAWREFDPSASWSATNRAWKIDLGGFQTDPNKSTGAQAWELISRWTWQGEQNIFGKVFSHGANLLGQVNEVNYFHGATVLSTRTGSGGMTLGSYILGNDMVPDYRDHTFVHEYGHYLQGQKWGPLYITLVANPSLASAAIDNDGGTIDIGEHHDRWFEAGASRLGANYFDKYYSSAGFDKEYFYLGWNLSRPVPYKNPRTGYRNQPHPKWGKFHWSDPFIHLRQTLFPFFF